MAEPSNENIVARAEVRLFGLRMGGLVQTVSDRIYFTYTDEFSEHGLEPSPLHLPVDEESVFQFDELHDTSFQGLPGVFADALPDAFGRAVIRAYFEREGRDRNSFGPIEQLLYIGTRSIGALEFHPPENPDLRGREESALDLRQLALGAGQIVRGETDVAIPELYKIGSSAGGRRPKATVNWNPETRQIRSGRLEPGDAEIPCILKFDGTHGGTRDQLGDPRHYNRVEAAYGDMAREAGIEMPEISAIEQDGYYHLLIPRFDIKQDGTRLHQHTFGGLTHTDYEVPAGTSYEQLFRTAQQLGLSYDTHEKIFRRMVFNVCAVNCDDHVKNTSFHMNRDGEWSLAPAYDLTFAHGEGNTRGHQMTIRGKRGIRDPITRHDLRKVGKEFGVSGPSKIIEEVESVLTDWPSWAKKHGVPDEAIERIRSEHKVGDDLES
ncbi:MAG: type II toxin-antitoxin system HipA family toxin [bacterium]